jgi:hypothetical protein
MHHGNQVPFAESRWSPGQWGPAGRALLLAVALCVLAYMVLWTRAFGLPRPEFLDPEGLASFGITLVVIVALCGALAVFVWDVFCNPQLGETARIVWSVVLCVGNVVVMPVYWALYLSRARPPSTMPGPPSAR